MSNWMLLGLETAFAQEPPPAEVTPIAAAVPADARPTGPSPAQLAHWKQVDRRAHNVFTAGAATGLSGIGLEVLGALSNSSEVQALGALGELTGAPMMAGGAARSARSLREQGADVSSSLAYTAWGLWGGGLALALTSAGADTTTTTSTTYYYFYYEDESAVALQTALSVASLGCRVSAYVTAAVQQGRNHRARVDLDGGTARIDRHGKRVLALSPVGAPGYVGLSLSGAL